MNDGENELIREDGRGITCLVENGRVYKNQIDIFIGKIKYL